jgi:CRISPR-associated protein Csh1
LINNIFSFEKEIFNKIFNLSSDEQINYFSDLKLKDSILQINLLKYRKAIYNYIYKSKIQSITQEMFNDLVCSMILDDIKNDKYNNNKHTKINSIIEKLNIWFNLYEYFQNNKNNKYMKTKIKELQEKNKLISETDNSIETDEEFAFVSGQVIFYLLSLSESSNKTHALLEPFLQKIDIDLFKQSIINLFNKYKHNIYFKQSKFEKLISEILCYVPEKNIKELMPYILAGYFSENEIFKKKDNNISTKNEDEINN